MEKLSETAVLSVPQKDHSGFNQNEFRVTNAGLVLLAGYTHAYFERLGLMNGNEFLNPKAQTEAIRYLQYLAKGPYCSDESMLKLNKVLCGWPLANTVPLDFVISPEAVALTDGLIHAVIDHWAAIGDSSVSGFRSNWLIRDGLLIEQEDRWVLTIEKRPYDILIQKLPFSFSLIRHPWMSKPLQISWFF
jgi:hypothetical protein